MEALVLEESVSFCQPPHAVFMLCRTSKHGIMRYNRLLKLICMRGIIRCRLELAGKPLDSLVSD